MSKEIEIQVNGEKRKVKKGLNLKEFFEGIDVNPEIAAVKLNREDINTEQLEDTVLHEGDELEFIFFMGGGAGGFDFSEDEIERYSRHIILEELGGKGQQKIKNASVLVVGAGGLGSPVSLYLAAAGVGTLGIIDSDVVDLSNLQRQILHSTADIGRAKVESAAEQLQAINPEIEVITYNKRLNKDNVLQIIKDYEIIVDGVDNFPARYLLNDACVMEGKTLVEAGILKFEGQVMTIKPGQGPCYRCVFRQPPEEGTIPSCQEAGVLGAIAGTIGTLQATEVLKLITEVGKPLVGRLLLYNAKEMSFREVQIDIDKECPVCGENPSITELLEYEISCNLG